MEYQCQNIMEYCEYQGIDLVFNLPWTAASLTWSTCGVRLILLASKSFTLHQGRMLHLEDCQCYCKARHGSVWSWCILWYVFLSFVSWCVLFLFRNKTCSILLQNMVHAVTRRNQIWWTFGPLNFGASAESTICQMLMLSADTVVCPWIQRAYTSVHPDIHVHILYIYVCIERERLYIDLQIPTA